MDLLFGSQVYIRNIRFLLWGLIVSLFLNFPLDSVSIQLPRKS